MDAGANHWPEAMSGGLLRNKALRSYLNHFSAREWGEVTKLTMLYGLLGLQKLSPDRVLSVEELRNLLTERHVSATVEGDLPDLQMRVASLQAKMADVADDIFSGSPSGQVSHTRA